MILSEDRVKEIIKEENLVGKVMILLIRQYIFELKSVNIQINEPDNIIRVSLMNQAFSKAKEYYLTKYKENV